MVYDVVQFLLFPPALVGVLEAATFTPLLLNMTVGVCVSSSVTKVRVIVSPAIAKVLVLLLEIIDGVAFSSG